MVSLEDRLKGVHPRARSKVRDDAKYVSSGLQEYTIDRDQVGYWFIKRYGRGALNPILQGRWTSFIEAEHRLINYLKSKDKWGKAIYPDGKS